MHILVYFRCSTLNFHNVGKSEDFLSLFSLVLYTFFEMLFKTFQVQMVTIWRRGFYKDFWVFLLKFFRAFGSNIPAFFIFLHPKTYSKIWDESVIRISAILLYGKYSRLQFFFILGLINAASFTFRYTPNILKFVDNP